jgi:hypothetical protein
LLSSYLCRFMLYRRRDIKRMFAFSSIEHMGLITFAFGMGGALANFRRPAAHDHALAHQVGDLLRGRPYRPGQEYAEAGRHPRVSPSAIRPGLGPRDSAWWRSPLPPLGIFMSEFLIVSSTFAREPLLAVPVVFGLLVAFGALMLRLGEVAFGEPVGSTAPVEASYVPLFAHLGTGRGRRHLSAGAAGRMVPERGAIVGVMAMGGTELTAVIPARARSAQSRDPGPRAPFLGPGYFALRNSGMTTTPCRGGAS